MKRKLVFVFAAFAAAHFAAAYNPPAGGQSMHSLSSPWQLTSASSCAGGGLFLPGPGSVAFNPALPAYEQRIQLDTGFTALISTDDSDHPVNAAFQTGILVPWKMFTGTALLDGVFCNAEEMDIANSFNLKAGLSKEVAERISVGLNLSGGYLWGADTDWALGADIGVLYRLPSLAFMRDFRVGCAVQNLGKCYSDTDLAGIDEDSKVGQFPTFATVRLGAAAVLFDKTGFRLGVSLDTTIPAFQNAVFDFGAQAGINDMIFISVAESFDIQEAANGHENFMPAVGVSVKFRLNAAGNSYLESHSWDKSEMLASLAWQQRYSTIQAVSGGVRLMLGLQDEQPPVIQVWNDGEDK